jgi:hypothetical protein
MGETISVTHRVELDGEIIYNIKHISVALALADVP